MLHQVEKHLSHQTSSYTHCMFRSLSRARAFFDHPLAFSLALIVYLKAVSLLWRSSSWSVLDAPVDEIRHISVKKSPFISRG